MLATRRRRATTRLQQAAYDAQWAAALPSSDLGRLLLAGRDEIVPIECCTAYLEAIRASAWFGSAFGTHARTPLNVVAGSDRSAADRDERLIKIGALDRHSVRRCEMACLHELAHIVTPDRGPDGELREHSEAETSTRGHHHAWRANFVFIVQMTLGRPASSRLRHEFSQWGLPTR